jgi:hypothetical protein
MKELTYQESVELEQFYRETFQDREADAIEAERDFRLDAAREQQQAQMDELNFTAGGPRW